MSTPGPKRRRSSVPLGFLGTLALIAGVEATLRRHTDDFSRPESANWNFASTRASRDSRNAEVLGLGTSLVKYGVQSRVIQRETGKRTYNLAVFGGQMPSSYFILKQAIASGAAPKVLLLDCQDGPVPKEHLGERQEGIESNLRWWPQILSFRDAFDLAWHTHDAGLFADIAVAKLLPSYRMRNEVRSSVQASLRGQPVFSTEDIRSLRRNWVMNRGTHVAPRKPSTEPAPSPDSKVSPEPFNTRQFGLNTLSRVYAQKLFALTNQNGIRVLWLIPPIGPAAQLDRDRVGLDSYFTELARWAQSQSNLVTVVDGRRANYSSATFADTVHLDRSGGYTFSLDVAQVVKHALEQPETLPRWLALPRYRVHADHFPVEDVGQSRIAITNDGNARR